MKKLILLGMAALMLVFTACNKDGQGASKDLTAQQDSLALALGEFFASQFAQQQQYQPDSLRADKAEFVKGMKVAFVSDTTIKGQSYAQGMQMGMQLSQQLQAMAKEFGVQPDKVLVAFEKAIMGDSITADQNHAYQAAMDAMKKIKELQLANDKDAMANKAETESFFNKLVKKEGAKKIGDDLVYKIVKEGTGAKVNSSDNIYVKFTVTDKNGTRIGGSDRIQQAPASQFANFHPAMAEGITSMHVGSHYIFYANVGANVNQGMKPYDYVVFDVEVLSPEDANAQNDAANAPANQPATQTIRGTK